MGTFVDLTGKRFGRLSVLHRSQNRGRETMWRCRCDCGREVTVSARKLKSGMTKSCGCYRAEILAAQGYKNATHGMKKTRLYKEWVSMKNRCFNRNAQNYNGYGGRGITVCDEWRDSFEAFRDWSLANGYRDDLSIDRKDNNGPYSPDNCRWATLIEQANNKRNNRYIDFNGETHTIAEWSAITGLRPSTIRERLSRGWSVAKTLTAPTPQKRD